MCRQNFGYACYSFFTKMHVLFYTANPSYNVEENYSVAVI